MTPRFRFVLAANLILVFAIGALAWRVRAALLRRGDVEARVAEERGRAMEEERKRFAAAREEVPAASISPAAPAKLPGNSGAGWIAEILDGILRNPQYASERCRTFADLDADIVMNELRARWLTITGDGMQTIILHGFCHAVPRFARLLDVIDLVAGDADPGTRSLAMGELLRLTGKDFDGDPEGYGRWRERTRGMTDVQVWKLATSEMLDQARGATAGQIARGEVPLLAARSGPLWPDVLEGGLKDVLEKWIAGGRPETVNSALSLVANLPLDEEFQRRNVVPFLSNAETRAAALAALGRPENSWAIPLFEPHLSDPDPNTARVAVQSLCRIGDPAAIPKIIEALASSRNPEIAGIFNDSAMEKLTGVDRHVLHNGAWWKRWWAGNGERLIREEAERESQAKALPAGTSR